MTEVTIERSLHLTEAQEMFVLTAPSTKLNEVVDSVLELDVVGVATLVFNNDAGIYKQLVIVTRDGKKYTTGSEVLTEQIFTLLSKATGESYKINIYKLESKKHPGQKFLTCGVAFTL